MITYHHKAEPEDSHKTFAWWYALVFIAVTNILLWTWTSRTVTAAADAYQLSHLKLSGVYVFACAYRSILPRIDLERYCLIDTPLSNVVLGRSAATVAEICFAGQIALLLNKLGDVHEHPTAHMSSHYIVPAIAIAQACCWYGVPSLNFLAHAIEESIWTITSAVVGLLLSSFIYYEIGDSKVWYASAFGTVCIGIYVAFMVLVDVPMYVEKWRHAKKLGKKQVALHIGGKDAWHRRVVTKSWKHWEPEVAWLTLYFSCAVWTSIALVHFKFDGEKMISSF